jgi:CRP/FNR family transcriptional regulator, cyclic AMP receptor protein
MNLEDLLMYQTQLVVLPSGSALFSEGDSGDAMYVLMSGSAEVVVKGKIVETATTGAILGELALIDNSPRSASVIARTDCNLVAINTARFNDLVRELPDFALYVMRGMAERLRRLGKLL